MRLYDGDVREFKDLVIQNKIADVLANNYRKYIGEVSPSEFSSWNISLNFLKNVLDFSGLENNKMILEFNLPYSSRRIDALLFGKDFSLNENIVVIELKQWSNKNVEDCEIEDLVRVNFRGRKSEVPHPSSQVEGYYYHLKDFFTIFNEKPEIVLSACAYCHNYSKSSENIVLYLPKFKKYIEKYPLFSKEDVRSLGEFIKNKLRRDPGFDVFNRFIHSPIGPSKRLLEHTSEMINKKQIFTLIDEQIVAYKAIMHKVKEVSKSKKKSVIIVKGGPGTGKSVIALEVMGELMRQGKTVFHATGSSAFTKTLRNLVGKRADKFFKFFFSFTKHEENEIEILICDEAHRIRKDSSDYGVPYSLKSTAPQINDLIRPAKLSIFFIDEYQIVRPTEIGNVELIKNAARSLGVEESEIFEFELKTQFRCSGSDSYLQWIENILQIGESDKQFLTSEDMMEFKIFSNPIEIKKAIDEKNREKKNSSRLVAGFCWPWSKPNPDGTLVDDVIIGDFKMPWERKDQFWKWATEDEGMEQVGTVYTAQGFEFDYIGVIFGNDLVYDPNKKEWISKPENSHDSMVKRNNKKLAEHLKNVYRVLLSRAHKGVYVYFMDKNTERFFKSRIENPT